MSRLQVGYARVNINPELGVAISGYYVPRFAKGFLDDLEASAMALVLGEKKILVLSVDNCLLGPSFMEKAYMAIEEATGISRAQVFLSATHTHTSPCVAHCDMFDAPDEPILRYATFLAARLADACKLALADLKPAKVGFAVGHAPDRIAYIRRYRMKDGSTMTCPPVDDPNIDHPIGELDQRVNVLRIDREGGDSIVILNYGLHADTVNGEMISSDWVGWVRRTLDAALGGVKCMCIMGAQGDVGSTNVHPLPGDMNDTEISFDNEMKSPGMARFVGRALAGTVLQVYDKVAYIDVDDIEILQKTLTVPANVPDPEKLPLAHKYKELHEQGRDDLIPFKAMELTTVVAEALRMCRMENGPTEYHLPLSGIRIGGIAMVGIPGEPFTEIGVAIKEIGGFDLILPCALTNGYCGYFPVKSAFDEGGYEARTSSYTGEIADLIVGCSREILSALR